MSSEREKSRLALSKRSLCVSSRFSVSVLFLYACASGGLECARAVLLISNCDEYRDAFCLFLCAFVFDLSLGSFLTYPSILRWKTRASCGRKALKKTEALTEARKRSKSFLFSFFVSSIASIASCDGGCVVLVFSFRLNSLSRLSLNFSSLSKESRSSFPTHNHRH